MQCRCKHERRNMQIINCDAAFSAGWKKKHTQLDATYYFCLRYGTVLWWKNFDICMRRQLDGSSCGNPSEKSSARISNLYVMKSKVIRYQTQRSTICIKYVEYSCEIDFEQIVYDILISEMSFLLKWRQMLLISRLLLNYNRKVFGASLTWQFVCSKWISCKSLMKTLNRNTAIETNPFSSTLSPETFQLCGQFANA